MPVSLTTADIWRRCTQAAAILSLTVLGVIVMIATETFAVVEGSKTFAVTALAVIDIAATAAGIYAYAMLRREQRP
ncbi:hypothetical protein [Nocardia sp. NPDC049149]|uniref:hypothetical protein n=1 Tax=Nocardia sp. NPDC049149 TaxID=3364315 RepID=UPI0037113E7E